MYVIMLKTIENILNTVEKIFLQILFVAMTLVVLIAVFNRITVNAQMAWSDELSRYLFVWLTFIAAAYAAGGKAHIGVTALVDIFPPAMKRVVELLTYLLCLGLSFILVYHADTDSIWTDFSILASADAICICGNGGWRDIHGDPLPPAHLQFLCKAKF